MTDLLREGGRYDLAAAIMVCTVGAVEQSSDFRCLESDKSVV